MIKETENVPLHETGKKEVDLKSLIETRNPYVKIKHRAQLEFITAETTAAEFVILQGFHRYGIGVVVLDYEGKVFDQDMQEIDWNQYRQLKKHVKIGDIKYPNGFIAVNKIGSKLLDYGN